MVTVTKYIDIDVDMEDLDTTDLVNELKKRGVGDVDLASPERVENLLHRLHTAVRIGQNDRVPELARELVNEYFGACL